MIYFSHMVHKKKLLQCYSFSLTLTFTLNGIPHVSIGLEDSLTTAVILLFSPLPPGEHKRSGPEIPPKNLLAKPGQSGLRPPGFSALPTARLAAFGFVRSSSVSSVSSSQSNDSSHNDPSRASQRE